jgi:hypothetical protein
MTRRLPLLAALVFAAGCNDRVLTTLPQRTLPAPSGTVAATCQVTVATRLLTCISESEASQASAAAGGASRDRIIGGQDVYIKLASSNASYDGGTQVLSMDVTVQNLSASAIGTTDGSTVNGGVMVFFNVLPTTTGGTGTVTIANQTGTGTFMASNQPYFLYNQVLQPMEVSGVSTWQFNLPVTVSSFTFQVYVDAKMADEGSTLMAHTWTGAISSAWSTPGNWAEGIVPDDTMAVRIPALASLTSGVTPVLAGNAAVRTLRVGTGSTVSLGGATLTVLANVDATGSVTGGTIKMTGTGAKISGTVDALVVTGSTSLQGATKTTGALAVSDGTLTVSGQTLTVSIP